MTRLKWLAALLAVAAALAGAASAQEDGLAAARRLFRSQDWTATGLSCIHCHSDFNEKRSPDPYVRPGHTLYNSGFRSQYQRWDGKPLPSLEEAIETCMRRWMTERADSLMGVRPPETSVRQMAAYLRTGEISPERKSKPIDMLLADVVPGERALAAGDAALGAVIFRKSCSMCHISDGSGPAPSLVRNGYSRYQIARKIRGISNKGLRGVAMPPFSKDRLSDRELLNVVAFVYQM